MLRSLGQVAALLAFTGGCGPTDEDRASLIAADTAWVETVGDAEQFAAFFEPAGLFMAPDRVTRSGPAAIEALASEMFDAPGFELSWTPAAVEIARSGELGYTRGSYRQRVENADGEVVAVQGKYLTLWHRQPDGSWKVAVDIFNPS